jgi:hypothetical protein
MAAFAVGLLPAIAGACFPSLGDLTSGGGQSGRTDSGSEEGRRGDDGGGGGGDAEADSTSIGKDSAVKDANGDAISSGDSPAESSPPTDGSPSDAPEDADAGACPAALSSDPANCGSSPHDCQGGTCVNCQCQPVTLATTSGSVGIAIDSTYVYWANTSAGSSTIEKISKSLTAPGTPSNVEVGATNVQGIASDGTHVYWTNKSATGSIQRALSTGGGLTTLVTNQNQPDWIAVTVDGAFVVWTNQVGNQVMSAPVGSVNATPTQLNTMGEMGTLPAGIAIDATNVYFASKTSGGGLAESAPLAGGTVSQLGQATYVGITVDNDNVYWTGGFASPIVSQNVKGGDLTTAHTIASGGSLTCPLHLVSDGNNVYFFDQGTTTTATDAGPAGTIVAGAGALYKIPVGNSAPLPPPIVSGLTDPQAIAQDATALYWVTGGVSGAVMKVAK